jgi:AhpD family alkylhydroperoxidase
VTARVTPGTFAELGPVNWALCKLLSLGAGVPDAHLFSTLGRQRGLFRSWLLFSARLMPGGTLSRKDTEMVILRVAHLRDCAYERDHHVRLGRRAGITSSLLESIEEGPTSDKLTPRQQALLAAVDDLVQHKDISELNWQALAPFYDPSKIIELCLLVGQYEMLATTIHTLRIERDR